MGNNRDTTEQIDGLEPSTATGYQTAIRWLTPGAPARYTRLERGRISLGRADTAGVRLEASGVSRVHAEIHREGAVYVISDLQSRNGISVNGVRVRHEALAHNDVVRIGAVVGVVLRLPESVDLSQDDALPIEKHGIFGPGLRAELDVLRQGAQSSLPVVIVGETGVGKERLARVLHVFSGRHGPFHAVNCGAIPLALAEAELFGHRKGAFTGAEHAGLGHVRAAHGGTLFLDEFAELPLPIQAKLLRLLQDSEVTPLGDTRAVAVDVRVVTACQASPEELVREKRLREDLMMRLDGITLVVPPLRLRRVDVGVLLEHFLEVWGEGRKISLDAPALQALLLYPWPGNVRELEVCVRKLVTFHGHQPVIRQHMLPSVMVREERAADPPAANPQPELDAAGPDDLTKLIASLRANGSRVSDAAKAMGISRQRAYRLLRGRPVADVLANSEPPPSEGEGKGEGDASAGDDVEAESPH